VKEIGLYMIITNPVLSLKEIVETCIKNDISVLQLRHKKKSDKEILKDAIELVNLAKGSNLKIIINDRVDIAILAGADGVHLGQDDISYEDARKLLGEDKIIGLSTHSIKQAKDALALNPDYIGFGPVYATTTKENPDPTVGCENLKKVVKLADVPVVAIGGIFPVNLEEVMATGAKTICMVRYFMQYPDLDERIKFIKERMNKWHKCN